MTRAFIVWMFVCSLAVYSWASERMPWLILHPLLPLILLAGIGAQALWMARARVSAKIALGVVAIAAVGALYSSIQLSYFRSADPRELLVQVQSSDDVPGIRDEFISLQNSMTRRTGEQVVFQVDSWGGTGWPWSWYLRDQPLGYYDMSNVEAVPRDAPALLVADPNHGAMAPLYEDYEKRVPTTGVVGSRLGRGEPSRLAAVGVHARAVEPDGDDGRVALPAAGRGRARGRGRVERPDVVAAGCSASEFECHSSS